MYRNSWKLNEQLFSQQLDAGDIEYLLHDGY